MSARYRPQSFALWVLLAHRTPAIRRAPIGEERMSAQTINLDSPAMPTMPSRTAVTRVAEAQARRADARRLMRASLECFADGHGQAGEVLRLLSRRQYARAIALLGAA
jgi:hypothetical protein